MACYVDDIRIYQAPSKVTGGWCHLATDGPASELAEFGARLGLKPEWLQSAGGCYEHYDVTPILRRRAVNLGAIELTNHEFILRCVASKRQAGTGPSLQAALAPVPYNGASGGAVDGQPSPNEGTEGSGAAVGEGGA